MTRHEKAILALHMAVKEVARLSEEISAALTASMVAQDPPDGIVSYRHLSVNWLAQAYEMHYGDEDHNGHAEKVYAHHDGDPAAYLAQHCQHALLAHQLIQQRKQAKKTRAMCRRHITMLGKELAAAQPE